MTTQAAPRDVGVDAPGEDETRRARFRAGFRAGLGFSVPILLLAVAFGAVSHAEGWGWIAPIVASTVIFSGSAQFAMLTALSGGGGLVTAITSAGLINGRFVPMGVAAAASLKGGRVRRAIEGQAVVDSSFVLAHSGGGRFDRERLFGSTLAQYPAWILGTGIGSILGPSSDMVQSLGLDVAFPAFYVMLLWDELRVRPGAWRVVAAGALIAGVLVIWLPAGVALLCCTTAALIGLARPVKAEAA